MAVAPPKRDVNSHFLWNMTTNFSSELVTNRKMMYIYKTYNLFKLNIH